MRFPQDRGGMDHKECRARDTTSVRWEVVAALLHRASSEPGVDGTDVRLQLPWSS